MVGKHGISDIGPEGGVERRCSRPCAVHVICRAGIVFELPDGASPGKRFRDVSEVCLDARDLKGFSIDLIQLVASVVASQGGNGRADEPHGQWFGDVDVVGITESPV